MFHKLIDHYGNILNSCLVTQSPFYPDVLSAGICAFLKPDFAVQGLARAERKERLLCHVITYR